MPFIKSLAFKRRAYLVALILLLSIIIPLYSYCAKKKLVYIIIVALFSCQPSSCFKCTKLNIYSFCNVQSVSNAKYIFTVVLFYFPYSLGVNTWWYVVLLALC